MVLRLRQHNIGYTADGFYRSDDPTNSVKALKEGGYWLVIQTGLSLTRLTSPCYNNTICMLLENVISNTPTMFTYFAANTTPLQLQSESEREQESTGLEGGEHVRFDLGVNEGSVAVTESLATDNTATAIATTWLCQPPVTRLCPIVERIVWTSLQNIPLTVHIFEGVFQTNFVIKL